MQRRRLLLQLLLIMLLLMQRIDAVSRILSRWKSSCTESYLLERGSKCAFPSWDPDGYISECKLDGANWWCPTTLNYCTDGAFAWCPDTVTTYGGTDPGKECHLPFWYKGVEYRHCIRLDTRGDNYMWCSTTPGNYTGRWTRCRELPTLMPCLFRPSGAAATSRPFSAPNASSDINSQCVRQSGVWSCLTAVSPIARPCEETPTTEAGNDPGRPCHFPFRFGGIWRTECLRSARLMNSRANKTVQVNGTTTVAGLQSGDSDEDYDWCATTDSYDRDGLWTRCKKPEPARLTVLSVVLIVVSSVVAAACVAACLLYCFCEPASPFRRCRRRGGGRAGCGGGVRNEDVGVVALGDGNKPSTATATRLDARLRLWQRHPHQGGGSPLVPSAPPPQPLPPYPCSPPSYQEVLALTAACSSSSSGGGEKAAEVSIRISGVPA